jgi:hypothetical protein
MSKTLWHTIQIKVPREMVELTKSGKVSVKKTLTRTFMISKSQKKPAIKLIPSNSNKPEIINDGKEWDIDKLKERMIKAKELGKKNANKNIFEVKEKKVNKILAQKIINRAKDLGQIKRLSDRKAKAKFNAIVESIQMINDSTARYNHAMKMKDTLIKLKEQLDKAYPNETFMVYKPSEGYKIPDEDKGLYFGKEPNAPKIKGLGEENINNVKNAENKKEKLKLQMKSINKRTKKGREEIINIENEIDDIDKYLKSYEGLKDRISEIFYQSRKNGSNIKLNDAYEAIVISKKISEIDGGDILIIKGDDNAPRSLRYSKSKTSLAYIKEKDSPSKYDEIIF